MGEPTGPGERPGHTSSRSKRILGHTRSAIAVLAVAVGLVCVTVSPVANWGRNLVLDTDQYVETLAPLATDPAVQQAVIDLVSDAVSERLAVTERLTEALPKLGPLLGPPLQGATDSFVRDKTTEFVHSERFADLWVGLNRNAHIRIVWLLTGQTPDDGRALALQGTRVTLDLSRVVTAVEERLGVVGVVIASQVPAVGPTLQIADLHGLEKAQHVTRLLDRSADVLPLIGLGLIGLGIAVAHRRRRTFTIAAFGVAAGMFVVMVAVLIGRNYYLDGIPTSVLPRATASIIFDTMVRYLRLGVRVLFTAAVLLGIAGWLAGPGDVATKVRSLILWVPRKLGHQVRSTRVGPFVQRYASTLRSLVGALVVVLVMTGDHPTSATLLTYAAIAVVLLVIIEAFRAMARPVEATEGADTPD